MSQVSRQGLAALHFTLIFPGMACCIPGIVNLLVHAKADFPLPDTIKSTLQWVVTEWKTTNPGSVPFAGEGARIVKYRYGYRHTGMQEITFNPYASIGDKDYGLLYRYR